jgi:hypothetical protein
MARDRSPYGQPVVALDGAPEDVIKATHWRSTWMVVGMKALKDRGYGDRYLAALPPDMRETLPFLLPGVWVPIATARVHYLAAQSIDIPVSELKDLGASVFQRAEGTVLQTAVFLAKGAGADPWSVLGNARRIWERGARGGAVAVHRSGPKEAICEAFGCELFAIPYFRLSFVGVLSGILGLVSTRAYVRTIPDRAPAVFTMRCQWA